MARGSCRLLATRCRRSKVCTSGPARAGNRPASYAPPLALPDGRSARSCARADPLKAAGPISPETVAAPPAAPRIGPVAIRSLAEQRYCGG